MLLFCCVACSRLVGLMATLKGRHCVSLKEGLDDLFELPRNILATFSLIGVLFSRICDVQTTFQRLLSGIQQHLWFCYEVFKVIQRDISLSPSITSGHWSAVVTQHSSNKCNCLSVVGMGIAAIHTGRKRRAGKQRAWRIAAAPLSYLTRSSLRCLIQTSAKKKEKNNPKVTRKSPGSRSSFHHRVYTSASVFLVRSSVFLRICLHLFRLPGRGRE